MQGLLVNKLIYKKQNFKKWNKIFNNWFQLLEDQNISPIDYCMTESFKYQFDRIIIGVNNSKNFKEIINFKTINKNKMENFEIGDTKLLDPRKWK